MSRQSTAPRRSWTANIRDAIAEFRRYQEEQAVRAEVRTMIIHEFFEDGDIVIDPKELEDLIDERIAILEEIVVDGYCGFEAYSRFDRQLAIIGYC